MKIVFSDFDRTLVNISKGSLGKDQLLVLSKLKMNEILFSIVTGRCFSFFRESYPELIKVVSYFILSNGSSIYDVSRDCYIYHKFIDSCDLERIYGYAKRYNLSIYFNLVEKRIRVGRGNYQHFDFNQMRCEQVVLMMENGNFNDLIDDVGCIDGVVINNKGIDSDNGNFFLDINKKGVSKGEGISYLYDYLKISGEDAICFGDSDNDVSMFQVVGKKIAVSNASDSLKNIADIVIGSDDDGSVFHYLSDFLNKDEV